MDKENLDNLARPIVDIYQAIEDEIIMNIAKKISKHDSLLIDGQYLSWQARMLQEWGTISQENMKFIASISGRTADQVQQILSEAGFKAIKEIDDEIADLNLPEGTFVHPEAVAGGAIAGNTAVATSLETFMGTSLNSLNTVNGNMLGQANSAFTSLITQVVANVAAGTMSVTEAKRRALAQFADAGVPAFVAKNGAKWSPEAYVGLIMRQTINAMANAAQDSRLDEYGVDLVLITQHAGARPKCAPYQNRVFSRSGIDKVYPPLAETSIGQPDGLFGINCGHKKIPFFNGISKKPKPLATQAENAKTYEESQQQRKLERDIRRLKTKQAAFKAAGDNDMAKQVGSKIRDKQAQMRAFINKTGRTRRPDREQIMKLTDTPPRRSGFTGGVDPSRIPGRRGNISRGLDETSATVAAPLPPPVTEKRYFGMTRSDSLKHIENWADQLPEEYRPHRDQIMENISKMDHNIQAALSVVMQNSRLYVHDKGSFYSPKLEVWMDLKQELDKKNTISNGKTLWHEYGHAVDNILPRMLQGAGAFDYGSTKKGLRKAIDEDYDTWYKQSQEKVKQAYIQAGYSEDVANDQVRSQSLVWKAVAKNETNKLSGANMGSISDVMGGLTRNEIMGDWGHSKQYWKDDKTRVEKEFFAHVFSMKARRNFDPDTDKEYQRFKEYFPTAVDEFDRVLQEMLEGK